MAPHRRSLLVFAVALLGVPQGGPSFSVSVTRYDSIARSHYAGTTAVDSFRVHNTGTQVDNYDLTCSTTGSLACVSVNPASVALNPGTQQKVLVTYTTGTAGGTVKLTAIGEASAWAQYNVDLNPAITIVAPVLTSGSRALVRTRQPIVRATYQPAGSLVDTVQTVLKWRGEVVTTLARANRGIIEWEVDSTRWLSTSASDSGLIELTVCAFNTLCTTVTRYAVLLKDDAPVIGFSGMPFEALGRQFAAPFGPGIGVSGAEVETGFATVPFILRGSPRSAALLYSTRQSYPRVLVPVDLELTWPAGTPDQIKVFLADGAAKLDSLVLSSPTCATGSARRCRAVLQGDFSASSFANPTRKWLSVEARVTSGGTTKTSIDSVEVVIVDRRTTAYGSGWWPAGFVKLVQAGNDRVLVGANGTAAVFRGNGDSLYIAPPGDFSVLKKVGAFTWELSPRGSLAKLVFDNNGRLQASVSATGVRDSIAYSGATDRVTALVTPQGKNITFAYTSGTPKLLTITGPSPASQQTRIGIDTLTNQLTYDSLSSPTSRPNTTRFFYQTYAGTGTLVLTKRLGVLADTTVVTYDSTFRRRPTQVTLPQVQDETGASVKPVITYGAYERRGFGALVSLDSVYVEMKDPRNNWTRSLLNRWAQARKTWDALGTVGRAEYTPEGFVAWSEGKVADSSRVHHAYDSLRRLARTYIVRSSSDTLRLDSLVYDASHRVTQRIDARGKISRFSYNANGAITMVVTPNNDTTVYGYEANGQLSYVGEPTEAHQRSFTYNTTWRNLDYETDEATVLGPQHTYDALGRDSIVKRKVRVAVTSASVPEWQWWRVDYFYNAAGQVDSAITRRTDTCADPCTTPTWLATTDTLHTQRIAHRYDRAGRDSLRLNDRGVATEYLYDRLGRLIRRRPWTDSAAVKDSFAYDVAGNLKKTITRRGDTLTTNFDSRNRDTLSVIPGLGTLRKTFGGPADQLTRLWYDSFVDSIGGVNPELRWAFDQRGRLKGDTSYTGATVRATTYAYDTYERLSSSTDPLGTWTTRYETNRGMADTLITPYADTITYVFDRQGRGIGPTIRGGGPQQTRSPAWNEPGSLGSVTGTVATASSFTSLKYDRNAFSGDALPAPTPVTTEQHGSGATMDSMQDTLGFDAWGRLRSARFYRNGSGGTQYLYQFDRTGNAYLSGFSYIFDATTDRLDSLGGARGFDYDRAGNLVNAHSSIGADTTWTYGYDALNRLRTVKRNGTLIARYAYDVVGRRIAKRVYSVGMGGTVAYTRFVYHGDAVAFETDSAGNKTLRYTWGISTDDLLAVRDSLGNHYYPIHDQLHSVRGLVKRDGTWLVSWRYHPYGAGFDSSGSSPIAVRYRWTGREYDAETGWYFFRARYYDPTLWRFVQEDPIGYVGGGNLYAYGNGNPLDGRDSDGLMKNNEAYDRKFSQVMLNCFGNCSAPAWTRYEGFRGGGITSWDLLTSREQTSLYNRYEAAFAQRQREGLFDRVTRAAGCANCRTRALTVTEFGWIYSALQQLMGMNGPDNNGRLYALETAGRLIRQGRIGVNDAYVVDQLGGNIAFGSDPVNDILWVNGNNLSIVAFTDGVAGSQWMAFDLAHELAGHWRAFHQGSNDWRENECRADLAAAGATGLAGSYTRYCP